MEEIIWNQSNRSSPASRLAGLRNQLTFLCTNTGIMWGESMYKAELSDFPIICFYKADEPHPYEVLVYAIAQGKTNDGRVLYGRFLWAKDPVMCTVGGYGLYLLERFEQTHEMSPPPDFTNNDTWFDMKILIDANSSREGTRKEIDSLSYATLIRNICNKAWHSIQ